jgi:hypothetical protein
MPITQPVPTLSETRPRRNASMVFASWVLLATVASAAGWISPTIPPPFLPLMIWSPVVAFLAVLRVSPGFRDWVMSWDLRLPILFHFCRVVFGVWFLVLHARGALDQTFALVAGPGDIVAGALALLAARFVPIRSRRDAWIVLFWNAFALLDILVVFVTAQRIVFFGDGPRALAPLTTFPLGLVPSLIVPMILITHFVVFMHLYRVLKTSSKSAP